MLAQDSRSWAPCCAGTSAAPGARPIAGYGLSEGPAQACENQLAPGSPRDYSL